MWKFHDFPMPREIEFGDSRSAKSAILTHSEAHNFDKRIFTLLEGCNLPNQHN